MPTESRGLQHVYPTDVNHLPGLPEENNGMNLQNMCLRYIARNWEYMQEYERNNLIHLPARLRSLLLSNIAVYGPHEGVGYGGLRSLLVGPVLECSMDETSLGDSKDTGNASRINPAIHNEGFSRLDLSGAMGNSVSFNKLTELVEKPESLPASEADLSWEETMTLGKSLLAPIPILTYLSLSHPSRLISWPRLLSFAKHIPTLTHLSLAYWPIPTLTPNARTAVMQSNTGQAFQYGGTNYYSQSLDNDFREAAEVLRRLALRLYGLEYLDLTGCTDWLRALRWTDDGGNDRGLDWSTQWTKLSILRVYSGIELSADSKYADVVHFVQSYKEALATGDMLRWWVRRSKSAGRRANWVNVVKDDWMAYGELWIGSAGGNHDDLKRKRDALDSLKRRNPEGEEQWRSPIVFEIDDATTEGAVERLSVWEQ